MSLNKTLYNLFFSYLTFPIFITEKICTRSDPRRKSGTIFLYQSLSFWFKSLMAITFVGFIVIFSTLQRDKLKRIMQTESCIFLNYTKQLYKVCHFDRGQNLAKMRGDTCFVNRPHIALEFILYQSFISE